MYSTGHHQTRCDAFLLQRFNDNSPASFSMMRFYMSWIFINTPWTTWTCCMALEPKRTPQCCHAVPRQGTLFFHASLETHKHTYKHSYTHGQTDTHTHTDNYRSLLTFHPIIRTLKHKIHNKELPTVPLFRETRHFLTKCSLGWG